MTTPVVMPQLGETLIEGTLLRWLKAEGEMVAVDEPLLEISTDKVDTEIPSPAAGMLVRISVREGETVPVGTQLAMIEEDPAAALEAMSPEAISGEPQPPDATPEPLPNDPDIVTPPVRVAAAGFAQPDDAGPRAHILSPLVRKLATERGVDLAEVTGSGAGGRITKQDVLAAASAAPTPQEPAGLHLVAPSPAGPREELVPLSHIRRAIAQHMTESLRHSARAWTMVEVDMEQIVQVREAHKDIFAAREGAPLTYLSFVARATCEALMAHPEVNSALSGDDLLLHRFVNLGIAVAYEDGLIVPVIKDADGLNIGGLARAIADLASRARDRSLDPDEVRGATFTITNPGPYGSMMSLPIINQPNAAILSFDAVEKRPAVVDDQIVIRHRVYLSMAWDHRIIDGALATMFLSRIKEHLETWDFAEDVGGDPVG